MTGSSKYFELFLCFATVQQKKMAVFIYVHVCMICVLLQIVKDGQSPVTCEGVEWERQSHVTCEGVEQSTWDAPSVPGALTPLGGHKKQSEIKAKSKLHT